MHTVLADGRIAPYVTLLGRNVVRHAADELFGRVRASAAGETYDGIVSELESRLEALRRETLLVAINATGIILHTNLGRAPLSKHALHSVAGVAHGYSNLEYDLTCGQRGSRYARASAALAQATGAQDALVVNNCAAAVLLVLDTFAKGREVIVARSQLVEIGGGFRIPEVLERSGAMLVEVGTTNRVYIEDFERALSPRTALLLRTHPSNYRIEGFSHDASPRELVELGSRAGVPVVEDLGSGALVDLQRYGVAHERTVQEAIADGIGVVTFSGDKLFGGPQAGIVAGKARLVAPLKNNPLLRALRVGKMTLAALEATLELYRNDELEHLPVYRMLAITMDELSERSRAYLAAIPNATAVATDAYVGGGALAQERIASLAIALESENADGLATRLRAQTPPIVARIEGSRVLLDLRTIGPEYDAPVIAALENALSPA